MTRNTGRAQRVLTADPCNKVLRNVMVATANAEWEGCPPRPVRGSARQASIASAVNHTARLPRARRLASYSAQLVTRWFCFGM